MLSAWLGKRVKCNRIQPLKGGMINSVLRLSFDAPPSSAVVKLNLQEADFAEEAKALTFLQTMTGFPCPDVYLEDHSARVLPYAYLLLEDLPGVSLTEAGLTRPEMARLDRELAKILGDLHSHTRETYGEVYGEGSESWVDVFIPRFEAVRRQPEIGERLSPKVLRDVDRAIEAAQVILQDEDIPRLVHGDVWAGNIIIKPGREGWQILGIVDPGLQYADAEMELAYLESFNNPLSGIFRGVCRAASFTPWL